MSLSGKSGQQKEWRGSQDRLTMSGGSSQKRIHSAVPRPKAVEDIPSFDQDLI